MNAKGRAEIDQLASEWQAGVDNGDFGAKGWWVWCGLGVDQLKCVCRKGCSNCFKGTRTSLA